MAKSKKHPGFKAVANKIAHKTNPNTGKPYGKASAARNASASAKRANPRLKRV